MAFLRFGAFIIPRTGPNHSFICVHDLGCIFIFIPGVQQLLLFSTFGFTNHSSPSSSSVSALKSFSSGSFIIGPTELPRSVGLPTESEFVASTNCLKNKGLVYTSFATSARLPAEHF